MISYFILVLSTLLHVQNCRSGLRARCSSQIAFNCYPNANQHLTDDIYINSFHTPLIESVSWLHVCFSFQKAKSNNQELSPLDMLKECHINREGRFSPAVQDVIVSWLSKSPHWRGEVYILLYLITMFFHRKTRLRWNMSCLELQQMEEARLRPSAYMMSCPRELSNLVFCTLQGSCISSPLDAAVAKLLQSSRKIRW